MEQFEPVKQQLCSMADIPEKQWQSFRKLCAMKEFKKGDYFIREGDLCFDMGFLAQGLLKRFLNTEDGKEYVHYFAKAGDWVGAYHTVLLNTPSRINNIALEDSQIIIFDFKKFRQLYDQHPCWERVGRIAAEKLFIDRESREFQFLTYTAKERYFEFLKQYKDIKHRLTQADIATYLGVTPEFLSRMIRKMK